MSIPPYFSISRPKNHPEYPESQETLESLKNLEYLEHLENLENHRMSMHIRPHGFLLSTKCVFSPKRSGGLFIKFCQHKVPSLMSCRMEANSFCGQPSRQQRRRAKPKTKRFFIFFILTKSPNLISLKTNN